MAFQGRREAIDGLGRPSYESVNAIQSRYMHAARKTLAALALLTGLTGCQSHEPVEVIATISNRQPQKTIAEPVEQSDRVSRTDNVSETEDVLDTHGAGISLPAGDVKVVGWLLNSELEIAGKRARSGQTTFVVVEAEIPAARLWKSAGESFFRATGATGMLLAPGRSYHADGWAFDKRDEFAATPKSAFMPDAPTGDESVLFAFLVNTDALRRGSLSFRYDDSNLVELADEQKR